MEKVKIPVRLRTWSVIDDKIRILYLLSNHQFLMTILSDQRLFDNMLTALWNIKY